MKKLLAKVYSTVRSKLEWHFSNDLRIQLARVQGERDYWKSEALSLREKEELFRQRVKSYVTDFSTPSWKKS